MKKTMRLWTSRVMALTVGALMLGACSNDDAPVNGQEEQENNNEEVVLKARRDIVLNTTQQKLAAQTTDFAFALLKQANETLTEQHERLVFSPLSASMALSMLANGAAGETLDAILNTLGFNGFSIDAMNEYHKKLLTELPDLDNTATVALANSIWLNKGFSVLDSYANALTNSYDAESREEDFSQAGTKEKINTWCEEKTNGCIKNFIEELDPTMRCILLNALYFKGGWVKEFKEADTKAGYFTNEAGSQVEAELMQRSGRYAYYAGEHFAMAELPYGNEAYSLAVLLPNEGVGIDDCLAGLTAESWNTVQEGKSVSLLDIQLPKFKIERKDILNDVLKSMGMGKAFGVAADFTNLSQEQMWVDWVMQANYFSVDEQGTEAASVTGIGMVGDAGTGGSSETTIDFHVTRPFLFVLKEKSTGTILFLGKVSDL